MNKNLTFKVTDCQFHDHRRILFLKLLNARCHMFPKLSCYKGCAIALPPRIPLQLHADLSVYPKFWGY